MYIPRCNEESIIQSFNTSYVTAVLGPRRVGKSTLVNHFAEAHKDESWVFFNMEILEERSRVESGELKRMIEERLERSLDKDNKTWITVDEAQKCPAIFEQIKTIYDKYKNQGAVKFILTGSGFLSLHQLSAESLAGRIELFYLREFGLQEALTLQYKKPFSSESLLELCCDKQDWKKVAKYINKLSPLRKLLEKCLQEQLRWGGLPEVLEETNNNEKRIYLRNYLQTYLEKDIRAITTVNDLKLYQKLIDVLAEQTGSVRQDKAIVEALGCSRDTMKKYRGFLLATLVYQEIYPFIGSTLKRIVKSPKGYLLNNGLISYLTGVEDLTLLHKAGIIGHRLENWFLKELQIWLDRETKRSEIYYWRTSAGVEVDFIVEKKPHVYPFEVTYSSKILEKKIKNLITFLSQESRAKIGYYVYFGEYHYDAKQRICYLPLWAIG